METVWDSSKVSETSTRLHSIIVQSTVFHEDLKSHNLFYLFSFSIHVPTWHAVIDFPSTTYKLYPTNQELRHLNPMKISLTPETFLCTVSWESRRRPSSLPQCFSNWDLVREKSSFPLTPCSCLQILKSNKHSW